MTLTSTCVSSQSGYLDQLTPGSIKLLYKLLVNQSTLSTVHLIVIMSKRDRGQGRAGSGSGSRYRCRFKSLLPVLVPVPDSSDSLVQVPVPVGNASTGWFLVPMPEDVRGLCGVVACIWDNEAEMAWQPVASPDNHTISHKHGIRTSPASPSMGLVSPHTQGCQSSKVNDQNSLRVL